MENNNLYVSPEVEVVEVEIEMGFSISDPSGRIDDMPWADEMDYYYY